MQHEAASNLIDRVQRAIAGSGFLQTVQSLRSDSRHTLALGDSPVRSLQTHEIAGLERQGNSSPDWSRIRVTNGFDWRRCRHSSFHGDVILGNLTGTVTLGDGVVLPSGIERSTLIDCVVGHEACIRDARLVHNCVIGASCIVQDCGSITCEGPTTFGNGARLPLGPETGGREVAVFADMDRHMAATVALVRRQELLERYEEIVADYTRRTQSRHGYIGAGARLVSCRRIRNSYIGPGAVLSGLNLLDDSTLLTEGAQPKPVTLENGACVSGSLLHRGTTVALHAIVERSVLLERTSVTRHARVKDSVLGPLCDISAGEVVGSLVGPLTNMHHQSLLIATIWPEGKGNVSQGANIGSNHTSRAPDQELRGGEGMFLGLGVNIKFPANLVDAPYSILATGVTTQPQKLAFPFSLINLPASVPNEVPRGINQLIPAWVLTENVYFLKRCEHKFRARAGTLRGDIDTSVLSPRVVDLMQAACRRLEAVASPRETYSDREIPGLGKNFLLEKHRVAAIAGYKLFTKYYALLRLKEHLEELTAEDQPPAIEITQVLQTPSRSDKWEHARRILVEDFGQTDVPGAIAELLDISVEIAWRVDLSKAKDDERGALIIDDYREVHGPAAEDAVVQETWKEFSALKRWAEALGAVLISA
jgi:NDP-sugar pyrophosphorylase family protein